MNVTRWKRIGWLVIVFSGLTAYGAPALAAQPLPAPSAQVEPPPSAQAAPLSAPQAAAEKHATETRAVKDGVAKATWAAAATASNLLPGQTAGSAVLSAGETSAFFGIYAAPWHCAQAIEEAALPSEDAMPEGGELSDEDVPPAQAVLPQPLAPGFHSANGSLYYADRYGHLLCKQPLGAFIAKADGTVFQVSSFYRMPNVPYLSQIDDIGAWVGCEAVSALMGLQAKGYAQDIPLRTFLDQLPRSESDPEKGFVGSPYVPDKSKKTRTTIYPAALADYCNSYCGGDLVCSDFRGASLSLLQQELLAGNCVVAYETLWWETPYYRLYEIEVTSQRHVSNNHAVLVCGYDPQRGYFISDPYNYHHPGEIYQYWIKADIFEPIWNERKTGMLLR